MPDPAVTVVDHPIVATLMAELRDERTGSDRFRVLVEEISRWVAYEALRDLATVEVTFATPVGPAVGRQIVGGTLIVPVLRAGLGMVAGVQQVVPGAAVAHLGMRRDEETLVATTYLDGVPKDLTGRRVVVCDPMVATGGSIIQACELAASRGADRIDALAVIASQPGVDRVHAALPEVRLVCAALDDRLNERGYIVPGLGDAGDRLFGPPPA
jgi:uracil phosphoribosyltransferase